MSLRGQVGSDSDYGIDNISVVPSQIIPYDIDEDGDVDADDFAVSHLCFTGPAAMHDGSDTCYESDNNLDGHVDLEDYAGVQRCYSGHDGPPGSQCDLSPGAAEIALALQDAGQSPLDACQVLSEFGFDAGDVSLAMHDVYVVDAPGIAQILKDLFGLNELCTAYMLKDVGFSAGAVGLALRDTFGHDAESALGLLIDAGFSERLAEGAMLEAYNRLFAITDFKQVTCASTECTEDDFSTVRPDYIPVSFLNCTEPYVPGMIGETGDPTQYLASLPSPRSKTLWVKYELIDINSQTAVLVDLPTPDPASAVYQPMGEVDTYIANLAATLEHRRPATCEGVCSAPPSPGTPAIDSQFLARMASWENSEIDWPTSVCSANGGYWSMIRLPELVGLTTEDVPVYLWHSVANKRWPIMPANVDSVTDFSKERYLRGHAPVVRLPWDVHFYPVSVDWHFDHTQRSIQPGEYPPYLWVELDGSDDTQDFFYGEPRALDDIPMYAFWLEKPITLGDGEQIEVVDLVYYAFYSWNQGKYIVFAWRGNHVGDWEHVSIRLMWHYIDEAETTGWTLQPTQVYVGAHDRNSIYDWDTFPKLFGAQPIAYKAWGSNGFWPGPGRWHYNTIDIGVSTIRLADECTTGDLWNPASSLEPYLFNPDAIAVQTHLTARRYDCGISRANPEGYSLIDYSWPIWLSDCVADDRFSLFGQPSDPRDGPIEEWGNRECMCSRWGECPSCGCWIFCMLVGGPNGPADKLWQIHRNPRLR